MNLVLYNCILFTAFTLGFKDLEYWGVDAIWLELCCESKYAARKKFINETIEKEQAYKNACQVESIEDLDK